MKKKAISFGIVVLLLFSPFPTVAADFPSKPVTLIVPFAAGTGTDIIMRVLAETTSKYVGQPIIPENKPGGGGTIGPAAMAATAKPDGYTIAPMVVTMFRYPYMMKVNFDPFKDFTYIIHLSGFTYGVMVKGNAPWKTFPELISYAKANPGKVSYASLGAGGSANIIMEVIALKEGIKWVHVPMKGTGETVPAVLGGHVSATIESVQNNLVDSGDLRLLVVWTENRIKKYPNVPTLKECGYNMVANSPFGLAGPKNMDPSVVKILHDAFKKGMEDPAFIKILDRYNMEPVYKNTDDYERFVKEYSKEEKENLEKLGLIKK